MAPYLSKHQKVGLALALLYVFDEMDTKKRKWMKNRLKTRKVNLLKELDSDDFQVKLRMDTACFHELLELVRPLITKQDTIMRLAVPAEKRLIATLRYLATGRCYKELHNRTGISVQLLSRIIPETCWAIYNVLKKGINLPSTENEWKATAKQFEKKWQFNNCVGAMSGKHIIIDKPRKNGSLFYNYTGTYSIVLFAIVNANYEFIYVHSGTNGGMKNVDIVRDNKFYNMLISGELNLPESCLLPNTNETVPYVFLDDGALPADTHIMNPYINEILTREEEIFNYRFKRAQRTAENAFGVLASRFGILRKPVIVSIRTLDSIVMASCALHNFMKKKSKIYWSPTSVDHEDLENFMYTQGDWHKFGGLVPMEMTQQIPTDNGYRVRHRLKEYFSSAGSVSFQDEMVDIVE